MNPFQIATLVFLSMASMMLLFNTMQYALNRSNIYLYYSFYIACWIAYFYFVFPNFYNLSNETTALGWFIHIFRRVGFPMLSYIAYFSFANLFLNLENHFPKVWKLFSITQQILVVYVIFVGIVGLFFHEFSTSGSYELIHSLVRIWVSFVSFYGIIVAYSKKDPLTNFLLMGSGTLLVFGLIAMFMTIYQVDSEDNVWTVPIFYLQIGVIIEVLCFSLGLSYKNRAYRQVYRLHKPKLSMTMQLVYQIT